MFNRNKVKKIKKQLSFCGEGTFIHPTVIIGNPEKVEIGKYVHLQMDCKLFGQGGGISIGDGTIFAHGVEIYARNHMYDDEYLQSIPYDSRFIEKKVTVGKAVWVGANSMIMAGVTINDGAVVAAGSVVTKNVPKCAIVGGNPARVLKYRDYEQFDNLLSNEEYYIKKKLKI